MEGWIKLHRKFIKWEWFSDTNTVALFIHCLLKANFEDVKFRGKIIERGSFVTTLPEISKQSGLTIRQTRTSLDKLILTDSLTVKTSNKNRVISITNYDKYQRDDRQDDRQMTDKRQTNGQTDDRQATDTILYKEVKEQEETKELKNNNEVDKSTSKKTKGKKVLNCDVEKPEGLDDQIWVDYLKVRAKKNKPLTVSAFNRLKSQAEKAGMTLNEAITMCAERIWASMEWMNENKEADKKNGGQTTLTDGFFN